MLDPHFVLLGAALSLFGSVRYSVLTIRGRTQPNRVTWFLWGTAPIIGFFAQLDEGVGLPSILTLSVGVGPALVFFCSFVNRSSYWKISAFDWICGATSVLALIVWLSLDNPTLAIVFAVLADLLGGIPTLRKGWTSPETESPGVFALSGLNGLITVLTIDHWDVATWAFPVYIVVIGAVLSGTIVVRGRLRSAAAPPRPDRAATEYASGPERRPPAS